MIALRNPCGMHRLGRLAVVAARMTNAERPLAVIGRPCGEPIKASPFAGQALRERSRLGCSVISNSAPVFILRDMDHAIFQVGAPHGRDVTDTLSGIEQ